MKVRAEGFLTGKFVGDTYVISIKPEVISRLGFEMKSPFSPVPIELASTVPSISREVVKTTIETRNSDTTLTEDTDLQFTLEAGKTYFIEGHVFFDTVAAADFKYDFDGPASTDLVRIKHSHVIPGGTAEVDDFDTAFNATNSVTGSGTDGGYLYFTALIINGVSEDVFSLRWAQDTSDAGDTSVLPGSRMVIKEI